MMCILNVGVGRIMPPICYSPSLGNFLNPPLTGVAFEVNMLHESLCLPNKSRILSSTGYAGTTYQEVHQSSTWCCPTQPSQILGEHLHQTQAAHCYSTVTASTSGRALGYQQMSGQRCTWPVSRIRYSGNLYRLPLARRGDIWKQSHEQY